MDFGAVLTAEWEQVRGLEDWRQALAARTAVIGVVGLGYVGLPLARAFLDQGFHVVGVDHNPDRIEALRTGQTSIDHLPPEIIAAAVAEGRFTISVDARVLDAADAMVVCVPTPLNDHREPDMSYVAASARALAPAVRPGDLMVLSSTVYPGATRDVFIPLLEEGSGLRAGRDFHVAFSPEREDPGNLGFSAGNVPRVVGADSQTEVDVACAVFSEITQAVPVSSLAAAEAVKLTENIYRLVNIALINELKDVYGTLGVDVWEVVKAAATKPYGFQAFYPGPGLGGHCIPVDPFYLTWRARMHGASTRLVETAGDVALERPARTIEAMAEHYGRRTGRALAGARVLVVGVAYKKNISDLRESPALTLLELLEERGATVAYHDPHVSTLPSTRSHSALAGQTSQPLSRQVLQQFDCVLIATDHDAVDWGALADSGLLIFDTRNAMAPLPLNAPTAVVKI